MIDRIQGLQDEWASASLAIAALADALKRATVFEKPVIRRALMEAAQARLHLSFELMDAIEADLKEAA